MPGSDGSDDATTDAGTESDSEPEPGPRAAHPRGGPNRRSPPGAKDEPAAEDGRDDGPPRTVRLLGRFGVSLALGSLVLAVLGVAALSVGIQPWGNVVTTIAILGVSIAMIFAMAFQAYTGEYSLGG